MLVDYSPRVTVVILVYNEMATIEEIRLRVQAVDLDKEIGFVDDGSTGGTREFLTALAGCAKVIPAQMRMPQSRAVRHGDQPESLRRVRVLQDVQAGGSSST
ncbi:MAG: glycosyltransferase [Terriglobia bacterium]